jgi:hypothetical protein
VFAGQVEDAGAAAASNPSYLLNCLFSSTLLLANKLSGTLRLCGTNESRWCRKWRSPLLTALRNCPTYASPQHISPRKIFGTLTPPIFTLLSAFPAPYDLMNASVLYGGQVGDGDMGTCETCAGSPSCLLKLYCHFLARFLPNKIS